MINEPTTPTSVTNQTVTPTSVVNSATVGVSVGGQQAVSPAIIDNVPIPTARVEGLWMDYVSPWTLDFPWQYESIVKSNVKVTNL